jgi:hypothetical protein
MRRLSKHPKAVPGRRCPTKYPSAGTQGCGGMTNTQEPSVSVEAANTPQSERRRPDRIETVVPSLLPLLRDCAAPATGYDENQQHDLEPATGIVVSVLISAPIWALILWIAWRII